MTRAKIKGPAASCPCCKQEFMSRSGLKSHLENPNIPCETPVEAASYEDEPPKPRFQPRIAIGGSMVWVRADD